MSRGVPIPDVREQLFAAAERVLLRDGPSAVTGRAVTREAGCATGLLHNHFRDLDDFLAELVLDRFRVHAEAVAALRELAGSASVEDTLTQALRGLSTSAAVAVGRLVLVHPTLRERVGDVLALGAPGMLHITAALVDYLHAEQRLGRVHADADVEVVAVMLVATVHHVLLGHAGAVPGLDAYVSRLVRVLLPGLAATEPATA